MSGKIKKLYTSSSKCDDKLQFKSILEVSMVSTPEIFTYNIPISPGPPKIEKSAVQKNHYNYLLKFWMSKMKLMSAG